MHLPAINKENISEEESPVSLVLANLNTGQSAANEDIYSNLLCATPLVSVHISACVFCNNTHACYLKLTLAAMDI